MPLSPDRSPLSRYYALSLSFPIPYKKSYRFSLFVENGCPCCAQERVATVSRARQSTAASTSSVNYICSAAARQPASFLLRPPCPAKEKKNRKENNFVTTPTHNYNCSLSFHSTRRLLLAQARQQQQLWSHAWWIRAVRDPWVQCRGGWATPTQWEASFSHGRALQQGQQEQEEEAGQREMLTTGREDHRNRGTWTQQEQHQQEEGEARAPGEGTGWSGEEEQEGQREEEQEGAWTGR